MDDENDDDEIGYKIVFQCGGGRVSSHMIFGGVLYHTNKRTVPLAGYGPLCVFNTKDNALAFLNIDDLKGSKYLELWKCSYKPSLCQFVSITSSSKRHVDSMPKGTVLADSVILLEQMEI